MRIHTNDFKTEINKMGRQIKGKIFYYDETLLLTENEEVEMFATEDGNILVSEWPDTNEKNEIDEEKIFSISLIKNGDILRSLMKQLNFEAQYNLEIGTVVNAQFGVLVDDEY